MLYRMVIDVWWLARDYPDVEAYIRREMTADLNVNIAIGEAAYENFTASPHGREASPYRWSDPIDVFRRELQSRYYVISGRLPERVDVPTIKSIDPKFGVDWKASTPPQPPSEANVKHDIQPEPPKEA